MRSAVARADRVLARAREADRVLRERVSRVSTLDTPPVFPTIFLFLSLLPPTGSDSSTRIIFLEGVYDEPPPPSPLYSRFFRASGKKRREKKRKLPRDRANAGNARISSIRREPRAIMDYLCALVSPAEAETVPPLLLPRLGRI